MGTAPALVTKTQPVDTRSGYRRTERRPILRPGTHHAEELFDGAVTHMSLREVIVPLSEHEQRLLEQMEQQLSVEDPKFASAMRGSAARVKARRRMILGALGVLVGLGLVVLGVARGGAEGLILGIAAFGVMVAGACSPLHPAR